MIIRDFQKKGTNIGNDSHQSHSITYSYKDSIYMILVCKVKSTHNEFDDPDKVTWFLEFWRHIFTTVHCELEISKITINGLIKKKRICKNDSSITKIKEKPENKDKKKI